MEFYEYMRARIPDFEKELSMSDIEELKNLFDSYILWEKTEKNILELSHISSVTNVDYGMDFTHASAQKMRTQNLLEQAITEKIAKLENKVDAFVQK